MKLSSPPCVWLCECSISDAMPGAQLKAVKAVLAAANVAVLHMDDLCGAVEKSHADPESADAQTMLNTRLSGVNEIIIIACAERAVKGLLTWGGWTGELPPIHFLSLRDERCAEKLRDRLPASTDQPPPADWMRTTGDWIPWFPVIDQEKCVHCGKCFEFCLFGVYSRENGKVRVDHPRNCKNNCPACARVCPVNAVIFPKFAQPPINGEPGHPENSEKPATSILNARKAEREKLFSRRFEKKLKKTDN